ncbi:MAG: O-antigen ligase family protein [Sporolactobacillus sp.]
MQTIYSKLLMNIKKQPLIWGFALLYVLPPIGMAWLLFFGINQTIQMIRQRKRQALDPISLLFLLAVTASVGATFVNRQLMDLLSVLMIAAFYGIYLYLYHHPEKLYFRQYTWLVIWGGIYLFVSDKIFSLIDHWVSIPAAVSIMTGHLLLGYNNFTRLYGSAYNPNYACYLLVLSLSFLLVEILRTLKLRNYHSISLMLLLVAALDLGIYETGSRAGFMIMIGLHLMFFLLYNKWAFGGVTALMVILTPIIYHWMPRAGSTEMSLSTRLVIWKNSFFIFMQHPIFGTTSLGFPDAYVSATGRNLSHPHNLFLAVFTSSGIVCGLLFTAIVTISAYFLIRAFRQDKRNRHKTTLFLFALPTILEYGIMDFTLSSPQVMLVVLALAAFWIRYLRQKGWLRNFHSILLPHGRFRKVKSIPRAKRRSALALAADSLSRKG